MKNYLFVALSALLAGITVTAAAQPPWIFIARRVEGRITQVTQDDANGNPAFQVAAVIVDAPANKVYATALNVASQNPALRIVFQDSQNFTLKVSEGDKNASVTILPLSDKSSQILVTAPVAPPDQSDSKTVVVSSIMKMCNQLNRQCSVAGN
jgi:hypothetical protein